MRAGSTKNAHRQPHPRSSARLITEPGYLPLTQVIPRRPTAVSSRPSAPYTAFPPQPYVSLAATRGPMPAWFPLSPLGPKSPGRMTHNSHQAGSNPTRHRSPLTHHHQDTDSASPRLTVPTNIGPHWFIRRMTNRASRQPGRQSFWARDVTVDLSSLRQTTRPPKRCDSNPLRTRTQAVDSNCVAPRHLPTRSAVAMPSKVKLERTASCIRKVERSRNGDPSHERNRLTKGLPELSSVPGWSLVVGQTRSPRTKRVDTQDQGAAVAAADVGVTAGVGAVVVVAGLAGVVGDGLLGELDGAGLPPPNGKNVLARLTAAGSIFPNSTNCFSASGSGQARK